jgi:hypothetical protein
MNERHEPPPVDLAPLSPTGAQADRVIAAVMARLPDRPQTAAPNGVLELLGLVVSPRWIAAAVMLAFAGSAVAMTRSRSPDEASLQATVAAWAAQQHVPTNAELLAAFQGYQR